MKKGLELEFWVIDDGGELSTAAPLVETVDECVPELTDSLVEIKIPPYDDIAEIRTAIKDILTQVLEEFHGPVQGLVPFGTTLLPMKKPILPKERYKIKKDVLGDRLVYEKSVAGTHIHFDQEQVTRQLNLLTAIDPAIALVNSSPYHGERIADGARTRIYRDHCFADFPEHASLWRYTDSGEERYQRQHRLFEEFRQAALDTGADKTVFDDAYTPGNAIWGPVRLRNEFDTVEWRAPDTTLPSQIIQLVEDIDSMMKRTTGTPMEIGGDPGVKDNSITLPSFDNLQMLSETAIRRGLASDDVSDYLINLGFSVDSYDPVTKLIGGQDEMDEGSARRLRQDWAKKLEEDVENL